MIAIETLQNDFEVFNGRFIASISRASVETSTDGQTTFSVDYTMDDYPYREVHFDAKTLVACGYGSYDCPLRLRRKARSIAKDQWALRIGQADWDKDEWVEPRTYEDIEAAKSALSDTKQRFLDTSSPYQARLRKFQQQVEVYDYDEWAKFRFESGEWEPLPWANEPWVSEAYNFHFAHRSKDDPTHVAYWSSPEDAQRDRVEITTAGRYLTRYYGDILTEAEIEAWVHKVDPPGELVFSGSDPEAIYEAYSTQDASGLHSCMVYRDDQCCHDGVRWRCDGKSPVRVYGAGDLEVATLVRHGKRVGRALVWREKMAVGRVYGDTGRMMSALKAAGFQHDGNWTNNDMHTSPLGLLTGARLLKIEVDTGGENYAMPYIDFSYGVVDDGEYFILDHNSSERCHRTDGLMYPPERCDDDDDDEEYGQVCDHCGDDEACHTLDRLNDTTINLCSYCYSDHTHDCTGCSTRYYQDDCDYLSGSNEYACQPCRDEDAAECDDCGREYWANRMHPVVDADGDGVGDYVCSGCAPEQSNNPEYLRVGSRLINVTQLLSPIMETA